MDLVINREIAMKAANIAGKFAESASGLKVLVRPESRIQ